MICLKKLFVQVCAIPDIVSIPLQSQLAQALGFKHVTLPTRSKASTGKVKYVFASILKENEIKPLIIISSHDFHPDSDRIGSSAKIIECHV